MIFRLSNKAYYRKAMITTAGIFSFGTAVSLISPKELLPGCILSYRFLLEGFGRIFLCLYSATCIIMDYGIRMRFFEFDTDAAWSEAHHRSARRLVKMCERNGGLYIKIGQVFTSLTHLLPIEYIRDMSVLLDRVQTRPYNEVVQVIEQDFHKPIHEMFSEFQEKPIAAASLAQVHQAVRRDDGRNVAVKIQYIDLAQRYHGDMRTIKLMLSICGFFFPGYNLSHIMNRVNETVSKELDFRNEAMNCERAGNELRPVFGARVVTPVIHHDLLTSRVMVMDFVSNSVRISDHAGIEHLGLNVKQVSRWCLEAISYQMFVTGFVHADPHAGNILVSRTSSGKAQVVLLDHGLYTELNKDLRENLALIWTASVTHNSSLLQQLSRKWAIEDYELMASCFLQQPYTSFDSVRPLLYNKASQAIRYHMHQKMTNINHVLEQLPTEYSLVLRNIVAIRASFRELGNPINRHLVMLRYSMPIAAKAQGFSWFKVHFLTIKAIFMEIRSTFILIFLKWFSPAIYELLEENQVHREA